MIIINCVHEGQKLLNINILACSKAEISRANAQRCKPDLGCTELQFNLAAIKFRALNVLNIRY